MWISSSTLVSLSHALYQTGNSFHIIIIIIIMDTRQTQHWTSWPWCPITVVQEKKKKNVWRSCTFVSWVQVSSSIIAKLLTWEKSDTPRGIIQISIVQYQYWINASAGIGIRLILAQEDQYFVSIQVQHVVRWFSCYKMCSEFANIWSFNSVLFL